MRLAVLLALCASLQAIAATASAEKIDVKPVKGATYRGDVGSIALSVKVARNGRTATVSLRSAPAYCASGGGGEVSKTKPASISSSGVLKATVAFSSSLTHKVFADVTVKGNFFTFGHTTPVFDGVAKTTFVAASAKSCDGQQSFEAVES